MSKHPINAVRRLIFTSGAGRRIRTDDLLITNQLLYQLSYAGNNARSVAQCARRDKRTGYIRGADGYLVGV